MLLRPLDAWGNDSGPDWRVAEYDGPCLPESDRRVTLDGRPVVDSHDGLVVPEQR